MTLLALGDRLATGTLLGLAAFGALSLVALQVGVELPAVLLPLAVGGGVCWRTRAAAPPPTPGAPIPVVVGIGLLILAVLAVVGFGALSTVSRHWDGAVAWDVKARYLAESPTLDQPYFSDPNVLVHTRDYPLLQPLIVAAGDRLFGSGAGRLLFPVLLGLLALLVGVGLRRAGARGTIAWLTAAGCVLTPRLANPTSGGADSGYADPFLLVATTALAVGILITDARLLAAGAAIAVMVKPEGMVYAVIAIVVCWCTGDRRRMTPVTLGWLLGALAWLPVQRQLQTLESGGATTLALALIGIASVVLGADAVARGLRAGGSGRVLAAVALAVACAVALPWVVGAGAGEAGGSIAAYLADPGRALRRLARLPSILLGALSYSMAPSTFALAFVAPLVAGVAILGQRRRLAAPAVVAFVLGGGAVVVAAFLFSPEEDLDHHLRSSMSRLLLHWLGPAMVLAGVWSNALWSPVGSEAITRPGEAR